MKPYIHDCQNEDCQEEIPVEITYFRPAIKEVWAEAWEDSSPSEPAEIEYSLPSCPKCHTNQIDTKEIKKAIITHCLEEAD